MRSSTILIVLGTAILAVNGVATALTRDGIEMGTQEKSRLLRSTSTEHETDEERKFRFKLPSFRFKRRVKVPKVAKPKKKNPVMANRARKYHDVLHSDRGYDVYDMMRSDKLTLQELIEFLTTYGQIDKNGIKILTDGLRSYNIPKAYPVAK